MAESGKLDLSDVSPDRHLSGSGQRGSYQTASLDRSFSFREGIDATMSSIPSTMPRGNHPVTRGDVENFFGSLRFDIKAVAANQKVHHGELRHYLTSATGISLDDSSPSVKTKGLLTQSSEELKRIKSGLRENSNKARERAKIFSDALSIFSKKFPNMPSKKRSRLDVSVGDRSIVPLSNYRPAPPTPGKMGSQSTFTSGFLEQKKSMERIKNSIPSRRTRTSLLGVDARATFSTRQTGGAIERENEAVRLASSAVQVEDRTLSIGVESWEKSKMKKKRSAIKPDAPAGVSSPKSVEGYREYKQCLQQRPVNDNRQKTGESRPCRSGVANGSGGVGKLDGIPQQAGSTVRCLIPRTEHDTNSFPNDRMSRSTSTETERVNIRQMNKTNIREDYSSVSPTTNLKGNAFARAPRSGSMVPKLSPVTRPAPDDWELLQCSDNNRKRMLSTRSSSSSVAQWAGQRPQKISRIARRTSFVPIISNNDDTHTSDSISDIGNDSTLGSVRHFPTDSPQQIKSTSDHFSSAVLSESEDSGSAELKSRDKAKLSTEMNEKDEQTDKKGLTLSLPARKNKLLSGDAIGDGVRRQGRSGRGFSSARPFIPLTGNAETAKQLINARPALEKNERVRRPPTRRPSDRKPYTRQKNSVIIAASDFTDDGHEELLAAANAAICPIAGLASCEFWREKEPVFRFILDSDISYLKHQVCVRSDASSVDHGAETSNILLLSNGVEPAECNKNMTLGGNRKENFGRSKDSSASPLFERLLAAMISVEECEDIEDFTSDVCGIDYDPDIEWDCESFCYQTLEGIVGNCDTYVSPMITANGDSLGVLTTVRNGYITDNESMSSGYVSEVQYENLSLDERILLEIHSIGIFPDLTLDDGQTSEDEITACICKLENRYHEQVSRNKDLLSGLLKSASERKEAQEKDFESRAMDKLVGMAYEKYMNAWGPSASGGKGTNIKMARQSALSFVKRTIERCHKFEETGKSCFNEPMFRDILRSGSALDELQFVDSSGNGGSSRSYKNVFAPSTEIGPSASLNSQSPLMTSQKVESHDVDSSDAVPSANRVKKKELLLDNVGTVTACSSETPPIFGNSFSASARGKRSERDRDGNAQSRDAEYKGGNRKSRLKLMRENASLPEISEHPSEKNDPMVSVLNDPESIDASLQIPEMDVLTIPEGLGGQGEDLSSWLNIDDEGLQDHDFMGLEIPMDDLSDLNMML